LTWLSKAVAAEIRMREFYSTIFGIAANKPEVENSSKNLTLLEITKLENIFF